MSKICEDLAEIKKKLGEYVSKGHEIGYHKVRKEPVIAVTPDKSKIKPLRKTKSCGARGGGSSMICRRQNRFPIWTKN